MDCIKCQENIKSGEPMIEVFAWRDLGETPTYRHPVGHAHLQCPALTDGGE